MSEIFEPDLEMEWAIGPDTEILFEPLFTPDFTPEDE